MRRMAYSVAFSVLLKIWELMEFSFIIFSNCLSIDWWDDLWFQDDTCNITSILQRECTTYLLLQM